MKTVADLHVHTIASGHAYSTIMENARVAHEKGLQLIAITDHGPAMPGVAPYYFANMRILPSFIHGVRVLRGVEANIIDADGNLDMEDNLLERLDIVLGGFHRDCLESGSEEDNTRTLIKTMASGRVDIIVHPGNPAFPIDARQAAHAAKEFNVLLEFNNSSLGGAVRRGSHGNCLALATAIAEVGGTVALGSDAHYCASVGELGEAVLLAKEVGLRAEQVINTSLAAIDKFLCSRGRPGLSL